MTRQRAAVVGAGISGAACAGALAAAGWEVDVFDKARGAGGRLSTRRRDVGWVTLGAPFVSAWNPPFRAQLQSWAERGWLVPLSDRILQGRADKGWDVAPLQDHFLPVIETSRLVRDLLGEARLHTGSTVTAVRPQALMLADGSTRDGYDRVVCSVPAPQALSLLDALPRLRERLAAVRYRPIWSLLVRWPGGPGADVIRFDDPQIDMAVRQTTAAHDLWVVHSSHDFAEHHAGSADVEVITHAVSALTGLLGLPQPLEVEDAQHWLYARAVEAVGGYWLSDDDGRVALIGDGITGAGVERAWESGVELAGAILASRA